MHLLLPDKQRRCVHTCLGSCELTHHQCLQVLEESNPFNPLSPEPPRQGAVPVKLFGTYKLS